MLGDETHPPVERTPSNPQGAPVLKSMPLGRYEPFGGGQELYRYLRLKSLDVEPYQ
jgi:hypothetical protein